MMSASRWLGLTTAVALTACTTSAVDAQQQRLQASGSDAKQTQPNVLFIAVDDLKPLLNCYGYPEMLTPNFDRLAARGTLFLNAQCPQAVCGPSRVSLLTGQTPDQTKVWDLKTRLRDVHPDALTLPQHFREHGYTTAGVGKIEDPRSFEGWGSQDGPSWGSFDHVGVGRWLSGDYKQGEAPPTEMLDVADNEYTDGLIAESAVRQLQELDAAGEPFFLAVGFKKPHLPFTAPKKYWDMYDRSTMSVHPISGLPEGAPDVHFQDSWELRSGYNVPEGPVSEELQLELIHGYMACVTYVDAQLGKILDTVDELGLAEDTIIVLWGDHGFHLGDHGMFCKHTNYEQAARIPMIITAPGEFERGAKANAPVDTVDLFPTLTDLAGLPTPEGLAGTSLRPILNDADASVKVAASSLYPRFHEGYEIMGYTYRTERFRYVAWVDKDFRNGVEDGPVIFDELYDYEKDPLESKNLVEDPQYQSVVSWFQKLHAQGVDNSTPLTAAP